MFSRSNSIAHFNPRNIVIWLSMAFQAGSINAGGFLATHRFVTHTTGFETYFGTEIAQGNWLQALSLLTVPFFFLSGAMTSAYFVDRNLALGRLPKYDWMFGFIGVVMIGIAIAGHFGFFGDFGTMRVLSHDYLLVSILCFCSGVQNGTITSASGAVIRTTHLTGITTDLGIGLMRVLSTGQRESLRKTERRSNWMRFGLILCFTLGSTFAAFIFYRFKFWGFLAPALISGSLTALAIAKRNANRSGVNDARTA